VQGNGSISLALDKLNRCYVGYTDSGGIDRLIRLSNELVYDSSFGKKSIGVGIPMLCDSDGNIIMKSTQSPSSYVYYLKKYTPSWELVYSIDLQTTSSSEFSVGVDRTGNAYHGGKIYSPSGTEIGTYSGVTFNDFDCNDRILMITMPTIRLRTISSVIWSYTIVSGATTNQNPRGGFEIGRVGTHGSAW